MPARCNAYCQMHRANTISMSMGDSTLEATGFEHAGGGRTSSKAHKGQLDMPRTGTWFLSDH